MARGRGAALRAVDKLHGFDRVMTAPLCRAGVGLLSLGNRHSACRRSKNRDCRRLRRCAPAPRTPRCLERSRRRLEGEFAYYDSRSRTVKEGGFRSQSQRSGGRLVADSPILVTFEIQISEVRTSPSSGTHDQFARLRVPFSISPASDSIREAAEKKYVRLSSLTAAAGVQASAWAVWSRDRFRLLAEDCIPAFDPSRAQAKA